MDTSQSRNTSSDDHLFSITQLRLMAYIGILALVASCVALVVYTWLYFYHVAAIVLAVAISSIWVGATREAWYNRVFGRVSAQNPYQGARYTPPQSIRDDPY